MSITSDSYSIGTVEGVFVGALDAAKAACTEVGSVVSAEAATSFDVAEATSAVLRGAIMAQEPQNSRATFKLTGVQQLTAANIALAMGGTVSGNRVLVGPPTTISYKTLYVDGFDYEAGQGTLHVKKAAIASGASYSLGGGDQTTVDIEFNVLAKTDEPTGEEYFAFDPYTADTTAPTISSVVPADAATGVSKAVGTTVVWTFSEAIRSEDVIASKFIVHSDAGAIKAGTLTIGTNNTVVTFTPTAAWDATTKYHAIVVGGTGGVRDTAGNVLAATSATDFTTGA